MMDLNQVTISSSDIGRAVRFYECLGLRLIVDSRPRYVRMMVPGGNSTFSIHHTDSVTADESAPILYFESENLDDLVGNLELAGLTFDLHPVDQRWGWREAHLKDPDNNRLILYHAGENRKEPPWRITSQDFMIQPYLKEWIFLPEKSQYAKGKMPTAANYKLTAVKGLIHANLSWIIDGEKSQAEFKMALDGAKHKIDKIHTIRCYVEDGGIVSEQFNGERLVARALRKVITGGLLSVEFEHYPVNGASYSNLQIYRPLI